MVYAGNGVDVRSAAITRERDMDVFRFCHYITPVRGHTYGAGASAIRRDLPTGGKWTCVRART